MGTTVVEAVRTNSAPDTVFGFVAVPDPPPDVPPLYVVSATCDKRLVEAEVGDGNFLRTWGSLSQRQRLVDSSWAVYSWLDG